MDSSSNLVRGDKASTKKRRHRGPRRRKNRRPSFAAQVIESPHLSPARRPEGEADAGGEAAIQSPTESRQRRQPRLGQLGEQNLSDTSLDSEALLDHRKQPMMRARRESRLAQSIQPDIPTPESPRGTRQPTSRTRVRRFTPSSQPEQDEDFEEADDRTPLMQPSSIHNSNFVRYGTNVNENYSPRRPSLSIPIASSISRRSPPASYIPGGSIESQPDYDVNNPPSVPGSPKAGGPEMGYDDALITGQEFNRSASPQSPTSLPLDAVIDMDGVRMPAGTVSAHESPIMSPPDLQRRRTVTLPVEEDVCFPTGGLEELAEDITAHAPSEDYNGERRRRRRRVWPDLSALEEWSQEEKEARSGGIRAKRISEPVLVGGRLRPRNSTWKLDEEEAPFRFTYFNEEFHSTIHSQTISELVQPGQTFRNLFIPDPPELESDSDEDEPAETNGARSNSHSPHKNNASNLSDLLSHDENGSGTWSHKAPSPKPVKEVKYGPRPTFWLDVLCPTDSEMRVLSKAFGIHALTAEDIMTQEAREKVELFRNYYFINYRTFEQDRNSPNFLEPVNMYVVVFRDGLLSFHFSRVPHPANVRRRVRQLRDYLILSADWISYALIDDITDVFGPLIHNVEDEVDEIDDIILRLQDMSVATAVPGSEARKEAECLDLPQSGSDMLRRVGACRKKVMGLYRLLGNKADVIKGFAKRCNEQWEVAPKSEIGLYLGDIQDHILTMTGNLTHYETLLSRAHSNYLAQINIRMNERQEQTADVLGKLTVLGTIVLPMNIICGMWGMNVKVPGQDVDSLNWFLSITAGLIVFAVVCFYVAKRVYGIV